MDNLNRFKKIQEFLHGKLSEEEAQSFQVDIKKDKKLAEEVAYHRLEQEMMGTMLDEHLEEKMKQWENTPQRQNKWWWLLLPLGLIGVAIWLWPGETANLNNVPVETPPTNTTNNPNAPRTEPPTFKQVPLKTNEKEKKEEKTETQETKNKQPSQRQVVAWLDDFAISPHYIESGNSRSQATLYDSASIALNNKDFTGAVDLFERLKSDPDYSTVAKNNLGYLYFHQKQFRKALLYFQEVSLINEFDFYQEARWMEALCLLGSEDYSALEELLYSVSKDPDFRYQDKVEGLKNKLDSTK